MDPMDTDAPFEDIPNTSAYFGRASASSYADLDFDRLKQLALSKGAALPNNITLNQLRLAFKLRAVYAYQVPRLQYLLNFVKREDLGDTSKININELTALINDMPDYIYNQVVHQLNINMNTVSYEDMVRIARRGHTLLNLGPRSWPMDVDEPNSEVLKKR